MAANLLFGGQIRFIIYPGTFALLLTNVTLLFDHFMVLGFQVNNLSAGRVLSPLLQKSWCPNCNVHNLCLYFAKNIRKAFLSY